MIDKSAWGPGKWQKEPDVWEDTHLGFSLMASRHPFNGCWRGYIKIPQGHLWYRMDKEEINARVHGGLTFSDSADDVWWVGFDCGHGYDFSPVYNRLPIAIRAPSIKDLPYRDLEYVKQECRRLAEQAAKDKADTTKWYNTIVKVGQP